MVILPVPECKIGIRYTQPLVESPHCLPVGRMRVILVAKDKWKALELLLPRKIVNQMQHCIPREIAEISAATKD